MSDQSLREALEKRLGSLPLVQHENGYPVQALPKAELLDLLAAHPAEPAASDYSQEEIASKIADRVPHADLDGFTLSERLRIGKAVAPLFAELLGPRPMPTREQIAEAMHDHMMESHGWRQGCRQDVCIDIFLDRAGAVLALLTGAES
jgi:hypothetical protein